MEFTPEYIDTLPDDGIFVFGSKIRVSHQALVEACDRFILYTVQHPELRFYVTKIGCGIAGWKVDEVAQAFVVALASFLIPLPDNIVWPREFYEILDSHGLVG